MKPPIKDTLKEDKKDKSKVLMYTHSIENHLWKRTTSLQRTKRLVPNVSLLMYSLSIWFLSNEAEGLWNNLVGPTVRDTEQRELVQYLVVVGWSSLTFGHILHTDTGSGDLGENQVYLFNQWISICMRAGFHTRVGTPWDPPPPRNWHYYIMSL